MMEYWSVGPRIHKPNTNRWMDGTVSPEGRTKAIQDSPQDKSNFLAALLLHTVLHPKAAQLLLQTLHRRPQPLHVAGAGARPHPQQPLQGVCCCGLVCDLSVVHTMAGCMGTRRMYGLLTPKRQPQHARGCDWGGLQRQQQEEEGRQHP